MQTAADLTAEAIRQTLKDLNEVIFKVRRLHLAGKNAPNAAARYRTYVHRLHDLQSQATGVGPLFDHAAPIPYRDQLVGYTAEQRKALEWKGVFDHAPFLSRSVPSHFQIAAE